MISAARLALVRSSGMCRRMAKVPAVSIIAVKQQQPQQRMVSATLFLQQRHFSSAAPPAFLDVSEVTDRILSVVKNFDQIDANKVTPETNFAKDLGLDSLDVVEVVMAIEDEFAIEIPDQEADKIATIADAVKYISSHPMAK